VPRAIIIGISSGTWLASDTESDEDDEDDEDVDSDMVE